jgi:multidrug efflux pump subunit AcrB
MDIKTSIFPVIEVGLAGDIPYRQLRELARQLERKLENIPGVSGVNKFGYLAREIKVDVLPDSVSKYQVPLREITGAIRTRNIRSTGGSFESYTSERNLVTLAQFDDPMEVGDVIVRSTFDGPAIKVKDLAVIRDDFEDEKVRSRMNGRRAISFQVNKKESADAIRTVSDVKELIAREAENMPEGIEIMYSNDFSRYVENRFDVVMTNMSIGLILVVIVLALFLNIRSAFWVAMGIPVTLAGVVFMLPAFGAYLDSITLIGMIIVIGIIVDDGIIIAENVQRHRERGAKPLDAAVDGIREVFPPVVTTILSTFLAFAPMFLMSGILGSFIFVIPLVITLALFISLFEAVVALPAHLTMGLHRRKHNRTKPIRGSWFNHLLGPWKRVELWVVRLRYPITVVFILLLGTTLWYAANFIKFELFPSSMAEQFNILVELPKGASLGSTSDRLKDVEALVGELPENELESFVSRIGTQEVYPAAGYPPGENENWAFVTVNLTPYTERTRTADDIVEALRRMTDTLDGIDRTVYAIEGGGPPVGKPITIRIVGSDDALRTRLADSVMAFLGSLHGVKDPDRDDKEGKEQVEIKIDYVRLSRLELTVADVAQNIRIAYDGEVVTSVRYGDEDVDFRVQLHEQARGRPEFLSELLIPNRQGRLIPLKQAARFQHGPGPSSYQHFDNERTVTIVGDIVKGETTSMSVTKAVVDNFDLDKDWPGMRFVIGGEAEQTEESMGSLFQAFILAIIGMYFLLILLFNSPTQPLIVMASIPFGIMGVIVTFALHNEPMGFVAMLGIIGLAGVLVNDSLVLVNHINRLRKNRPTENIRELIAEGATDRLRAVILTSLTTVAGRHERIPNDDTIGANIADKAPNLFKSVTVRLYFKSRQRRGYQSGRIAFGQPDPTATVVDTEIGVTGIIVHFRNLSDQRPEVNGIGQHHATKFSRHGTRAKPSQASRKGIDLRP